MILEWEAFFLLFFLISLSKGYRHPDGIYRPEGVYGTLIPPFADTTQKALKQILYARPRNRQVTHFVAVDNDARWDHRTLGAESVIRAPRGSEVPVKVVYSGINLMDLK